jgi:prepilin-type N-terminal cleavage/methylation domain-containing protein
MLWSNKKRGFTLIELMVVIALTTIMASVFLLGRNQYNEKLNLKTQTYALAGLIRQAQGYSLGVRADAGQFGVSYGVFVSRATPSSIIFFADRNKNAKYDSGEEIENYTMSDGVQVGDLCGYAGGSENCIGVNDLTVTFNRPDPSAVVSMLNNGGNPIAGRTPPGVIHLEAPSGLGTVVSVDSTGQVSIQ